ncbi:MAG: polysaccharide biosynthesis/export family protein [Verrucomicrobiota bacterium]|jgi:polysaccharide biosynthesis/export protein
MRKCFLIAFCVACASLLLAGCKHVTGPKFDPRAKNVGAITNLTTLGTNAVSSALLQAPTNYFTLGPGDRLEIEIFGETGSRATTTVGPDGKIYYHLLPGIDVWGLTLADTKALLERELSKFVTAPQVGVTLRGIESKRVWLLGRLQNSGVYPMAAPMTLLESISLAGGSLSSSASGTTEELADLRHSFIIREGKMLPVDFHQLLAEGNMAYNIYLRPDDFVYLPSALARDVYVLGAVRQPKAVGFGDQATLVTAIASAGGTIKNAYDQHVAIVRGSLTNPQIAIVDFRAIVKGEAPDVKLEPRDIVYVPFSPYRILSKYADLILTTFVRAVAINEGARAASKDAGTVSVGISIGR